VVQVVEALRTVTPAAAAASRTSAAVALLADGFSVSTCRPAATAARFRAVGLLGGGL
jgi:hypothetical protein